MTTNDIEARARAYAEKAWPGERGPLEPLVEGCYLDGAKAEIALERKRIGDALARWYTAHMAEVLMPKHWEQVVKIINGEGA